ncbi:hypothetical protein N9L47_00205 [Rhodobacteraceae bacterium]|nr:hypothetical protein [Paracoccaceae bacterium]
MLAQYRWCFIAIFLAAPAVAKDSLEHIRSQLMEITGWSELCEVTDCDQFPVGYNTYAFGPSVYYFPTMSSMTVRPPNVLRGGVKAGRFYELDSKETVQRSLSISGGTTIPGCCHHLLTFYGLADAMPTFRERPDGNRMPSAWTMITSFDQPRIRSARRQRLGYGDKRIPTIRNLIGDDPLSYNDDFWLLSFHEPDARNIRYFEVLSKRQMLNGHFVYAACHRTCSFRTLRLEETVDEVRPHLFLGEMLLTGENMFLCSSEELTIGCDPAPEIFDQVAVMLALIEGMFDAAAIFPGK